MSLDEPKYTLANIAEAFGWPNSKANFWVSHAVGGAKPRKDKRAKVAGQTAFYTARTALQIGIGARLVGFCGDAKTACRVASGFTHEWNPLEAPGHKRDPGELYPGEETGIFTALVAYKNAASTIVRFGDRKTPTLFDQGFFPAGGQVGFDRAETAQILFLNPIVKAIRISLEAAS